MTQPYVAPVARPARGILPWALGFIGVLLIPFLGIVIAGVVMTIVGLGQRRHGGLAATNGRRAANWGLTMLVIIAPCIALWIVALSIQAQGFFPWGLSILVWAVLGLVNLVAAIIGVTSAAGDREVRFPAIPFVRR